MINLIFFSLIETLPGTGLPSHMPWYTWDYSIILRVGERWSTGAKELTNHNRRLHY